FVKNNDGSYSIRTKVSADASCIEITSKSRENGANVQEWTYNGGNNQNWYIASDNPTDNPATETPSVSDILWGDANVDKKVSISDSVAILQSVANVSRYALTNEGKRNADVVDNGSGITGQDAAAIQLVDSGVLQQSELPIKSSELNR
ncbi:MAG TPA: hypothetical protein DCG30_04665, partial [Ruminococcus sp.]|nr:hypothetical protein [Ruminococcus sp.]